jgi:hypothetical protein
MECLPRQSKGAETARPALFRQVIDLEHSIGCPTALCFVPNGGVYRDIFYRVVGTASIIPLSAGQRRQPLPPRSGGTFEVEMQETRHFYKASGSVAETAM